MSYEYSGYLRSLIYSPDRAEIGRADAIDIPSGNIAQWKQDDDERDPEWRQIPLNTAHKQDGVTLKANFERMRAIETTGPQDPSFWAPLTCRAGQNAGPFPVDAHRYPVIEITYRCLTKGCRPAWQWHYPGGLHFDWLRPANEWVTVARLVQHRGFPGQITALTLRLYSVTRSVEEWEIKCIRFRALTAAEAEALRKDMIRLDKPSFAPKHYPLLDSFVPLGVCVNASTGRALADLMETPFRDYWRLVMEDVARGHHNCMMVEDVESLSSTETTELLGLAASFGLRVVPVLNWSASRFLREGAELTEKYVRPHAESEALAAWCLESEPSENSFESYCRAKELFEAADESHPLVSLMRDPNATPLFAKHFAASGISYFKSNDPWQLGDMVRTHLPLVAGQQFWVTAPAYIYATGTPRWNTCPEVRLMINHAFANGARGWFSYCYHNVPIWVEGPFKRSLAGPFLTFSDIWIELSHRVERFRGLSRLLLKTRPGDYWIPNVKITSQPHPNTRLPEGIPHVSWTWLHGADFGLLYVVNNDINEVTGVNIDIPTVAPYGQKPYDMTDFVRSRDWRPMPFFRHIEMFPGQGQIIMFAPDDVAVRVRDRVIESLIEDDRRRIGLDLGLARRYGLDIRESQEIIQRTGLGSPLEDLQQARRARDGLTNTLYRHGALTQARSALLGASSALCGCDGALCLIHDRGRVDEAHERGIEVLALSRRLNQLRLKMQRGHAADIIDDCKQLAADAARVLATLRGAY